MEIFDLRPGTPMEFSIASTNSDVESDIDEDRSVYISSVFGVTKNKQIIFHIPTRKGQVVTIPMNVPFDIVFNTKGGMFQVTGEITKRGKLENFPVYVFEPSTDLRKMQRRDYFRFQCLLHIKALPIPEDVALLPNMDLIERDLEKFGNTYGNPIFGDIVDISGGGCRFRSKSDIGKERYIYCGFVLNSPNTNKIITLVARRVKTTYNEETKLYDHRIEFIFKEPENREIIIKYIFDEQRRLRKKDQG